VVTVPSSELQSYPIGGNVTMRPGTKLVKITTDPTVYAVEPGGELRSIVSEDNAINLYGLSDRMEDGKYVPAYVDMVVDVPDAFFVNYEVGSALTVGEYPTGTLLQEEGSSDVYFVDNGDYRAFSGEAAFLANNFKFSDVITTSETITANGSEITGFDTELFNPAGGASTGSGSVATGTGLSAALSASTPVAQSIPYNVQGQVYTSVNLTASNDGAVELTGLEVRRTGLGETSSFDKVYVEVDGVRHGNKRTLGSDNVANLYFNTDSSKIIIPAGQTVTLDIVADMASENVGGDNALSIVSASSVDTNATVSGLFPITGNLMSISSVGAPGVSIEFIGNEDDLYLGDEQVEVAEFEIENSDKDNTNEDISFTEITLENTGTADNDEVINYTLYDNSDEIISGPVDADSNDMIKFVLEDAMTIEDNDSETFVVKADIYDGRGKTVKLALDETTDVKAVGLNNGFNAVVDDGNDTGDEYTIFGGDLSFSEANTNPGDTDVAPKDEDVLFLAADVEALEEMMTITEIKFTLEISGSGGSATSLEDVTLYLDGKVVAGPIDFVDDTIEIVAVVSPPDPDPTDPPADSPSNSQTEIVFDEEFQVSGTQLLEVKADIADTATAGDYHFKLDSDNVIAENEEGDEIIDTSKIKGSVDGATVTIANGSVSLSVDNTYGGRDVVAGTNDLLVGQYILETDNAEGIKINKYSVNVDVEGSTSTPEDTLFTLDNIEELYISEDDDIITDVSETGNKFNVNQELSAGTTKVIKVYASVDDDFDADGDETLQTTLSIDGEGLVSSEPVSETIAGQTMTFTAGLLTAVVSAGTPDSDIVVAGTSNVEVAEWKFEAENTSYMLEDIEVQVYPKTNYPNSVSNASMNIYAVKTLSVDGNNLNNDTINNAISVPTPNGYIDLNVTPSSKSGDDEIINGIVSAINNSDIAKDGVWMATPIENDPSLPSGFGDISLISLKPGNWSNMPINTTVLENADNMENVNITESQIASGVDRALVTEMTLNGETVSVINGVAKFNGPFEVKKDEDLKLSLSANFNDDFNSIDSGNMAEFAITKYSYKAENKNSYSTYIPENDENFTLDPNNLRLDAVFELATNEFMYIRNTVPTFVASAGETTSLKITNNEIMDLAITADTADDVTIIGNEISIITNVDASSAGNHIIVEVIDSNNNIVGYATTTDATLLTYADNGKFTTEAGSDFNGTYGIDWTVDGEQVISAGETEVYTVRISFSDIVGTDKSLTVELKENLTWWDEENLTWWDEENIFFPDTNSTRKNISDQADLINDLSGSFEINNK
jgi:hypothetical protein